MEAKNSSSQILFVEDQDDLRDGMCTVLELANYKVMPARDGLEALNILKKGFSPDLIISDIKMAIMDGYELLQAVRDMPELDPIPFIFLSGYGGPEYLGLAHKYGIDEYLVKPLDPDRLLIVVANKLRRANDFRRIAERELNESRQFMVQLLAHELRTPLTTVSGGIDLLQSLLSEMGMSDTDMKLSMRLMQSGLARLMRITEQSVRYTELINGYAQLHLAKAGRLVPIARLCETAVLISEPDMTNKNISMQMNLDIPATAQLYTIPELILAAFQEILRNAIAFSPAESTIQLDGFIEDDRAHLIIRDQGIGIAQEDLENVWNLMVQSNRQRDEQQGSGLGLAIARETILMHQGTISLDSELDKGTTVIIVLPVSHDELVP